MHNSKDTKRANFRVIEAELRQYSDNKRRLAEYYQQLGLLPDEEIGPCATRTDGVGGGSGRVSDPTFEQTVRLLASKKRLAIQYTSLALFESGRRVKAIEETLERMESSPDPTDRLKLQLIEARYFLKHYTPDGLALRFSISKMTVYRWCEEVVQEIADRLGYVV